MKAQPDFVSISSRLAEEELYEQVASELSRGERREGLWVKALAKAGGNTERAQALYIEYRIQALMDEAVIAEQVAAAEAQAEREAAERRRVVAEERRRRKEEQRRQEEVRQWEAQRAGKTGGFWPIATIAIAVICIIFMLGKATL